MKRVVKKSVNEISRSWKKIDLILMIIYPVVVMAFSLLFKFHGFLWMILFYIPPSIYLSLKNRKYIKKAIIFSILLGVPFEIMFEYIGHKAGSWIILQTIFSFKIFGLVPLEAPIWGALTLYITIMFYEYFLNKHPTDRLKHPRFRYLIALVTILFTIFLFFYFVRNGEINIKYIYVIWGLSMVIIPLLLEVISYPKLIKKFVYIGLYFFYFSAIFELTSLKLGHWRWMGTDFVGWFTVFGDVKLPIDNLLAWWVFLAVAIVTYYEFFDDDQK
ncbi:hypothetical protein HYT23_01830 [Candidatus Pacearchaeota archaeon]|nr:hypothetical protein [Candidatus Pacearchaeota archaeon]